MSQSRNNNQSRRDNRKMQEMVTEARRCALGDSNDGEIGALQEALEFALKRWPKVNPDPVIDEDDLTDDDFD